VSSERIRILGIDPGLRITGFGIIEKVGTKLAYLTSGCVRTPPDGALPLRLKAILDGLREVIATHQPQQAAVEIVFVNVNPQSHPAARPRAAPPSARRWTPTCRWPNTPPCR
jgi:crossover junction endodeoxyribonuclease RuvC